MDEQFMDLALELAGQAQAEGEIPVGAIIVTRDGAVAGRGFNQPISSHDPTAHAEIVALRDASNNVENYRLSGLTMYCTKEPCVMCAGAIIHARIERLVFGAFDSKAGAAGSVYNVLTDPRLNHQVEVVRGIRGMECSRLLQSFFEKRRNPAAGNTNVP